MERAGELGCVLVTQDADLLRIAHEWQEKSKPFAGLVFAHQENVSIGRIISDLELIAQCCEPDELRDRVIYLPLR
jgi:hypothetical protein